MILAVARIAAAVVEIRHAVPLAVSHRGPVPLADYFPECGLDHVELPVLTRGSVAEYLLGQGMSVEELGEPAERLAGFLCTAGRVGWAFVNASEILPRRRFTAAHELGHFLLHREEMGRFRADTDKQVQEADDATSDRLEREANRFAAELLVPAEVCEARVAGLKREHGCCPRDVLAYRLASELLVSRQAMRFRLDALEIGDD